MSLPNRIKFVLFEAGAVRSFLKGFLSVWVAILTIGMAALALWLSSTTGRVDKIQHTTIVQGKRLTALTVVVQCRTQTGCAKQTARVVHACRPCVRRPIIRRRYVPYIPPPRRYVRRRYVARRAAARRVIPAPRIAPPRITPRVITPRVITPRVITPRILTPRVLTPRVFTPRVFTPRVFGH